MGSNDVVEGVVAVVLSLYLVVGLVGNLLTIVSLLRCARVRTVTAAFIISLCAADCLFCVLVLPWEVSRLFAGHWLWGQGPICTILPFIRYWNVAVSLLSIAMITINRYILIGHFNLHKKIYTKFMVALMIGFCWLFPLSLLIPTAAGKWGRFGFSPRLQTCSIIDQDGRSPKKTFFGLGFCVPAIIIIICYSLIFSVIRKSEQRMQVHKQTDLKSKDLSSKLSAQQKDKEERRKRNEWRITKMILTIFVAFVLSYLPITVIKFADPDVNHQVWHLIGYLFIYLSCCINPIIYVIMNRQYRQAYKTVLLCTSSTRFFHTDADMRNNSEAVNVHMRQLRRLSDSHANRLSPPPHDNPAFDSNNELSKIPA